MVNAIISIGKISGLISVMEVVAMPTRQRLLPMKGLEAFLFFRGYHYEKMWGRCGAKRPKIKKRFSAFALTSCF